MGTGSAGAKGREKVGTAGATDDLCRTGSASGKPWPFTPAARQVGLPGVTGVLAWELGGYRAPPGMGSYNHRGCALLRAPFSGMEPPSSKLLKIETPP